MGLRRNKDEYWKMELVLTRDQLDQLTPDNKRIAGNEQDQIRYWEAGGNNKQFHFLTSPEETSIGFANYTNTNRKGSLLEDLDEMNDDDKSLMSTIHDWDTQDRFFFKKGEELRRLHQKMIADKKQDLLEQLIQYTTEHDWSKKLAKAAYRVVNEKQIDVTGWRDSALLRDLASVHEKQLEDNGAIDEEYET